MIIKKKNSREKVFKVENLYVNQEKKDIIYFHGHKKRLHSQANLLGQSLKNNFSSQDNLLR